MVGTHPHVGARGICAIGVDAVHLDTNESAFTSKCGIMSLGMEKGGCEEKGTAEDDVKDWLGAHDLRSLCERSTIVNNARQSTAAPPPSVDSIGTVTGC